MMMMMIIGRKTENIPPFNKRLCAICIAAMFSVLLLTILGKSRFCVIWLIFFHFFLFFFSHDNKQ